MGSQSQQDPRRILVIEDSLCLQSALTRLIRGLYPGVGVDWATTADEIFLKIEKDGLDLSQAYRLALVDHLLPGKMSGFDFCELCLQRYPHLPILLTSGMGVTEFLSHGRKGTELPPFLPKPFSLNECRNALALLLPKAA